MSLIRGSRWVVLVMALALGAVATVSVARVGAPAIVAGDDPVGGGGG